MITNKDLRVEGRNLIINGEKHPLDPAVDALIKRANTVQGKLSALDTKLDAIEALEKTASGNPISLTGVAAAYAISNIMTIEPIQSGSGDPSPTNVRPISGLTSGEVTRTGFNIWNEEWEVGDIAFATGMDISSSRYIRNKGYIPVIPNMAYYYCTEDSSSTFLFFYDENYTYLGQTTGGLQNVRKNSIFTTPNCAFMRFAKQTTTYNNDICINISDPDKNGTYEPYTAANATITFGQTVYGGSVNFKTGEVTVTHGMVLCDDLSFSLDATHKVAYAQIVGKKSGFSNLISSAYKTNGVHYANLQNGEIAGIFDGNYINIKNDTFADVSDVETKLAGVQVCYELATPTTLTLTPAELELLKGNNTISGNGVTINISYLGR